MANSPGLEDLPPPSAEAWGAGDLAQMIGVFRPRAGWRSPRGPAPGPEPSQVLLVESVERGWSLYEPGLRITYLRFGRFGGCTYDARFFRKITPRADTAERGDAEWLDRFLTTPLKEAAKCDS